MVRGICPDVHFVGFRTDFETSVTISLASAGVLTLAGLRPAGPKNPKGAPLPPPPLGYVPDTGHIFVITHEFINGQPVECRFIFQQ